MAICKAITTGLDKDCNLNAGGVNKIWVSDFENVTAYVIGTSSLPDTGQWLDGVTSSDKFYEIKTNKNVNNFTETVSINLDNSTTYFNQVITVELARRESVKREFIDKLIAGQKQLMLLVLDSNSNYWMFGLEEGAYVTAIEGGSGTKKEDKSGYTITFTAMEPKQAYEVDPTIIAGIIA